MVDDVMHGAARAARHDGSVSCIHAKGRLFRDLPVANLAKRRTLGSLPPVNSQAQGHNGYNGRDSDNYWFRPQVRPLSILSHRLFTNHVAQLTFDMVADKPILG
jgi:hypothetical protein